MNKSKTVLFGILMLLLVGGAIVLIYIDLAFLGFDSDPSKTTPNADKDVNIRNSYEERARIKLEIRRDSTKQVVYEDTFVLNSGDKLRSVYNFQRADPNGIESFNITAEYGDQKRSLEIKTDDCFGDITIEITNDDFLFPFYSTC